MRLVTLFLLAAFAASTVDAASYQKRDGTIVDPILSYPGYCCGGPHHYNEANLEPGADLSGAYLTGASLYQADLRFANLTGAALAYANLYGASLSDANLSDANLTGSNFYSAKWWNYASWSDAYYYTDNVPDYPPNMRVREEGIVGINPASGDFNSDGVFDAADYTVWQDNGGDQIDRRTWKDHFGQSSASGSGADHVPEPTTLLLALLALVAAPLRVRCG